MKRTSLQRISLLAAGLLLLTAVTGCGGSPSGGGTSSGGGASASTSADGGTPATTEASPTPAPTGGKTLMTIGTSSQTGTAYQIGNAIATVLNNHMQDVQFSAQATGGSNQNIELLRNGDIDFGLIINVGATDAYNAAGDFEGQQPATYLRNIVYVGTWSQHVLAGVNSGIENPSGFAGKTVAVGAAGSGTEDVTRRTCAALGLDYSTANDFRAEYMAPANSTEMLQNGQIDGIFDTQIFPASAHTNIMSTGKAKLISYSEEQIAAIMENPSFVPITIPAGTYPNQEEDVQTVGFTNSLMARDDLDEALAYEVTKILLENLDELYEVYNNLKMLNKETAMVGFTIDAHPGAAKYYKEIGLLQ